MYNLTNHFYPENENDASDPNKKSILEIKLSDYAG